MVKEVYAKVAEMRNDVKNLEYVVNNLFEALADNTASVDGWREVCADDVTEQLNAIQRHTKQVRDLLKA